MTETVQRAKQAREKLAAALTLLQSPEAGSLIDTVAEPVARAMGALHTIESSGGREATTQAPLALASVRTALAALQTVGTSPAAETAMEYIAGSLGLVHGLAEAAKAVAASGRPPNDSSSVAAPRVAAPQAAAPRAAIPSAPPPAGVSGLDRTQLAYEEPPHPPRMPSSPYIGDESRGRKSSKHASLPPEGMPAGATPVEANLGAHSPTNFYKGLSGNDVVDDGGLFVATYEIPRIGSRLWLTVNMPGGYDFQALAEVKWTRESGVGDAPPGFGCAFQSLSSEARKLVYRYVKNREPLFHDDL